MDPLVKDIILKYGSHILSSDIFQESFEQTHHYKTTVGDHTLSVTAEAVKLCLRHNMTDESTLATVVTSCLCHDLSLSGRKDKYQNNLETLIRHPDHSAQAYMDLTGETDERVLNAIRSHMFPLKPRIPRHKEGWILTLADKISSSMDILKIPLMTDEEKHELLEAAERITDHSHITR